MAFTSFFALTCWTRRLRPITCLSGSVERHGGDRLIARLSTSSSMHPSFIIHHASSSSSITAHGHRTLTLPILTVTQSLSPLKGPPAMNGTLHNHDQTNHESPKLYSVFDQVWDRQYGIWTKAPPPPKALGDGQDAFIAFRRKSATTNNADPFTHIELQDPRLVEFLRTCLPTEGGLFSKLANVRRSLQGLHDLVLRPLHVNRLMLNCFMSAARPCDQRQEACRWKPRDRSTLSLDSCRKNLRMRELFPYTLTSKIPRTLLTRSIEPKVRRSFNSCLKEA
jgi:hypothetical protein